MAPGIAVVDFDEAGARGHRVGPAPDHGVLDLDRAAADAADQVVVAGGWQGAEGQGPPRSRPPPRGGAGTAPASGGPTPLGGDTAASTA